MDSALIERNAISAQATGGGDGRDLSAWLGLAAVTDGRSPIDSADLCVPHYDPLSLRLNGHKPAVRPCPSPPPAPSQSKSTPLPIVTLPYTPQQPVNSPCQLSPHPSLLPLSRHPPMPPLPCAVAPSLCGGGVSNGCVSVGMQRLNGCAGACLDVSASQGALPSRKRKLDEAELYTVAADSTPQRQQHVPQPKAELRADIPPNSTAVQQSSSVQCTGVSGSLGGGVEDVRLRPRPDPRLNGLSPPPLLSVRPLSPPCRSPGRALTPPPLSPARSPARGGAPEALPHSVFKRPSVLIGAVRGLWGAKRAPGGGGVRGGGAICRWEGCGVELEASALGEHVRTVHVCAPHPPAPPALGGGGEGTQGEAHGRTLRRTGRVANSVTSDRTILYDGVKNCLQSDLFPGPVVIPQNGLVSDPMSGPVSDLVPGAVIGPQAASAASVRRYACLWAGCKVYNRPSTLRSWLERHVLSHLGARPFPCIVAGCGGRFSSQAILTRHVNGHFSGGAVGGPGGGVGGLALRKGDLVVAGGKQGRRRKQRASLPCTLKTSDFFDARVMQTVYDSLISSAQLTDGRAVNNSLTFHSQVVGWRSAPGGGKRELLLRWTPPNLLADTWVDVGDVRGEGAIGGAVGGEGGLEAGIKGLEGAVEVEGRLGGAVEVEQEVLLSSLPSEALDALFLHPPCPWRPPPRFPTLLQGSAHPPSSADTHASPDHSGRIKHRRK